MVSVSPSPGTAAGQKTSAAGKLSVHGIRTAINKISEERKDSTNPDEQIDSGNTKNDAETTTSGQSASQAATAAVNARFQTPGQYGATVGGALGGMLGAPLGGLAGLAGLGGAAGAGLGAAASAWKGLGASGGGGSGGGSGCGGGGCGGGAGGGEDLGTGDTGGADRVNDRNTTTPTRGIVGPGGSRAEAGSSPLTVQTLSSSDVTNFKENFLSDKHKGVSVVTISADDCGPCNQLAQALNTGVTKQQGDGLSFVKYSTATHQSPDTSSVELRKVLNEAAGSKALASGFPATFIIRDGKVVTSHLGNSAGEITTVINNPENKASITAAGQDAEKSRETEKIAQKEQRQEAMTLGKELFGNDNAKAATAFADMNQNIGSSESFGSQMKDEAKSYFAKNNEDETRSLSSVKKAGYEEIKFNELGIEGVTNLAEFRKQVVDSKNEVAKNREVPKPEAQAQPATPNQPSPTQPATPAQPSPSQPAPTQAANLPNEKKVSICAGGVCTPESLQTVNFKASDLKSEINRIADLIAPEQSAQTKKSNSRTEAFDVRPSFQAKVDPKDQQIADGLRQIPESGDRQEQETQFRAKVNEYEKQHSTAPE